MRDIIFITSVPNNDGSGLDYIADYQEFNTDHPEITIGTTPVFRLGKCSPVIGKLWFEGCSIRGYPYGISTGALLHLAKWVEEMREAHWSLGSFLLLKVTCSTTQRGHRNPWSLRPRHLLLRLLLVHARKGRQHLRFWVWSGGGWNYEGSLNYWLQHTA